MENQTNKKVCSNCECFKPESRGIFGMSGKCMSEQFPFPNTVDNRSCEFWEDRKARCEDKRNSVSHPSHYCQGRKYEPIKVIQDWKLDFALGSAVKYIARAGRKDDAAQDLRKAIQYLEFEIERIENEDLTREEGHD